MVFSLFLIATSSLIILGHVEALTSVAPPYGALKINGRYLQSSSGANIVLRGMSLYWSQWKPQFWNYQTMQALKCSWKATVVRAAMGVDKSIDGYLNNKERELQKVYTVVDAAISLGIYVIVDFHTEKANEVQADAIDFFKKIATKYGSYPHVIYELFNEPTTQDWNGVLKPYHNAVIKAIRAIDPDNVIIVGTRMWSQQVDTASDSPITGQKNIAYTLHWYAGSHTQWLRDMVTKALAKNLPIFVTEYGTTPTSANAAIDWNETRTWWTFLEDNKISFCNWGVDDVSENTAALVPGATSVDVAGIADVWNDPKLTNSGKFVKDMLRNKNNGIVKC